MSTQTTTADDARERLLAGIPVTERRLELAGVSTAVLEGGAGPPIVLLHEQGEFGASWLRVIPDLVSSHRVIAPDLPGHGASEASGELDADRVLAWLGELIGETCAEPPVLVGHMLGGAIAARYAVDRDNRLARLVLVDTFGLRRFRPAPRMVLPLVRYLARPSERSHDRLHRVCTADLEGMRQEMDGAWEAFQAYALDRMHAASVKAALPMLMRKLGVPAIPPAQLERITVPTTLIWGRHDPATPLRVAEAASARYGWELLVIDGAGDVPALEQPEAFLSALRGALGA